MAEIKHTNQQALHRIVIIGGCAGGLELATKLGDTLGKRQQADITLIDATKTHLWKPLLHEVAAGTLNSYEDELSYVAHAYWHHYRFRLRRVDSIDRVKKEVSTEPFNKVRNRIYSSSYVFLRYSGDCRREYFQ